LKAHTPILELRAFGTHELTWPNREQLDGFC
jgi:hypothetical protein